MTGRLTVALAVAAAVGCGGSTGPSQAEPVDEALMIDRDGLVLSPPGELGRYPLEIEDAVEQVLSAGVVTFRSRTDSMTPGVVSGSASRDGAYDLDADRGVGSLVLDRPTAASDRLNQPVGAHEATLGELIDLVSDRPFRYRFVDEVLWQRIPLPDQEERWIGTPAADLIAAMGTDPRASVDGGIYLAEVHAAIVTVDRLAIGPAGELIWEVGFDLDRIAPLASGSGTVSRLFSAGFDGVTGLVGTGYLQVETDGAIVVDIDVGTWWDAGYAAVGVEGIEGSEIRFRFRVEIGTASDVTAAEPPCLDPAVEEQEGLSTLVCPV